MWRKQLPTGNLLLVKKHGKAGHSMFDDKVCRGMLAVRFSQSKYSSKVTHIIHPRWN